MAGQYQTEYVFNGTDETLDVVLKRNGETENLSGVTAMSLHFLPGVSVNSDDSPDAFNWDTGEPGKVILLLGHEELAAGVYTQVKLKTVTTAKPNGEVWILPFQIAVEDL